MDIFKQYGTMMVLQLVHCGVVLLVNLPALSKDKSRSTGGYVFGCHLQRRRIHGLGNARALMIRGHGLQDYEAVQERVANYIKTAYATRRGISDTTATPTVTDENSALGELGNWLREILNSLISGNILPVAPCS